MTPRKGTFEAMTPEELAEMRAKLEKRFNPVLFHTQEDRDLLQKGHFRTIVWPALKSDPLVIGGLTMIVASFIFGMRLGGKKGDVRCDAMLGYRIKFQALVLSSIISKLFCRDLKKNNAAKAAKLAGLKGLV